MDGFYSCTTCGEAGDTCLGKVVTSEATEVFWIPFVAEAIACVLVIMREGEMIIKARSTFSIYLKCKQLLLWCISLCPIGINQCCIKCQCI